MLTHESCRKYVGTVDNFLPVLSCSLAVRELSVGPMVEFIESVVENMLVVDISSVVEELETVDDTVVVGVVD